MAGPEHYKEAAQTLADATNADSDADPADIALMLRFAQVHATLALAAATAAAQATAYDGDEHGSRSRGWAGVA